MSLLIPKDEALKLSLQNRENAYEIFKEEAINTINNAIDRGLTSVCMTDVTHLHYRKFNEELKNYGYNTTVSSGAYFNPTISVFWDEG